MHKCKSEIRLRVEKRECRRRKRYILPSRIIGTLGEDEAKSCKSNELIFTKATSNSGGHRKATETGGIDAVLSWILFICSVGAVFSSDKLVRERGRGGGKKMYKSAYRNVKRERMCAFL